MLVCVEGRRIEQEKRKEEKKIEEEIGDLAVLGRPRPETGDEFGDSC